MNGEYLTNTILFEDKLNWTGVLIEPVKLIYHQLRGKNRKVSTINTCLAVEQRPHAIDFVETQEAYYSQKMEDVQKKWPKIDQVRKMNCLPLTSIILAAGNPVMITFLWM